MTAAADLPAKPLTGDADARYAAYLADLAAHVDDPDVGEEYQAMLDGDPETRRALFDLVEAMAATPGPLSGSVLWMAGALLVVMATLALVVTVLL
jgi:hypothetical protein